MSSHREAPEISRDPVADSTDLYAFVSPDQPDTVTLIANYIPLQEPSGGPNFYDFGEQNAVIYEINVDNDGDGLPDVTYRFEFDTRLRDKDTFLYNTGPITALNSPNWNSRQFYTVRKIGAKGGAGTVLGSNLPCPPCNIGPLSTPNYAKLAKEAVHDLGHGVKVFAGQRAEGFYVDLGSIFDLANLRPFQTLQLYGMHVFTKDAPGVNATNRLNVHSMAIQVPITDLVRKGASGESDPRSVIGVWTTASRRAACVMSDNGAITSSGPWRQVSRLGNPLINEVIIPLGEKDLWNHLAPLGDKQFAPSYAQPELAALLPPLYPGVFPNLAALVASGKPRVDLEAILLTGIPSGIIPGFQNNTGSGLYDMLRLNTAIAPSSSPNILGLLGGDLAGFPNGRRVFDDVVTVELRAVAGVTYALVDSSYTPDAAAGEVTDGLTPSSVKAPYLDAFPYLGVPYSGYDNPS
jgi:Domain of unknown function (DUF4331)